MSNVDSGMHYLEMIRTLSDEQHPFSIVADEQWKGYYSIRIGKYSYIVDHFSTYNLMNAYVALKVNLELELRNA